ncbi:katanin p60 ATPase-containing subunit A-like 2 isoform X1 [Takifugu rubripes]|uniref:katanin p60 ATPase-containing subunit A-like 2 isoform X1 n=2 Tax=Takifugu rubripes TaxID=31033 RepID=UPI00114559BE|nr:katanin p60 ATPase-containing subunit A-like 2 isoform X1 [Takifugu rubripes]
MEFSYQSMKVAHQVREADEMKAEMRKKSLLVLIYEHLLGQGYVATAAALDRETRGEVRKFEVCDNVDLEMMLLEFESYHYIKFHKFPKVVRKVTAGDSRTAGVPQKRGPKSADRRLPTISCHQRRQSGTRTRTRTTDSPTPVHTHTHTHYGPDKSVVMTMGLVFQEESSSAHPDSSDFGLNISSITGAAADQLPTGNFHLLQGPRTEGKGRTFGGRAGSSDHTERLLKPLSGFCGTSSEMSELAAVISRDIYMDDLSVQWDNIIGLEEAKKLVKEAVVYPIKYPQLFTGIVSPWKALLLYGPPGTGKTLLAKAVAAECRTTFFNISASSITSKWRGDSEKLVRVLFELARYHAPSTIFLDELESLMGHRGSGGGEHEGSRRMKAELLVQMDGLKSSEQLVFVLAASNLPWELDQAVLRRLEKRILVGLPSWSARCTMISHWLPPRSSTGGLELQTQLDYEALAEETEGYSGSDIRLVCKEAAMRSVRKIFDALESHDEGLPASSPSCPLCPSVAHVLSPPGGVDVATVQLESVTTADFLEVMSRSKPSCRNLKDKYAWWESRYQSAASS